jgi:tRNA A-37 threonylcarbamoyl transferase component Bud32
VTIDREGGVVVKEVHKYLEFGIVAREAHWLEELAGSIWVPRLIALRGNTLTLSYAGERAAKATLPPDWEEQAERILADLERHQCRHNDIKPRDLLVLDGRLRLIDFGWATRQDEAIPVDWPPRLGAEWKAPHGFDDAYSLRKSLAAILG